MLIRIWCVACCALFLSACGGGGSSSTANDVGVAPASALSLLGPDYLGALNAPECGTSFGAARAARYPAMPPSFSYAPLRSPVAMRSDRQGGLLIAEDEPPQGVPVFYRVDANGNKTPFALPSTRVFDVAPDGLIWFSIPGGAFGYEDFSGAATGLVNQQGYTDTPVDGALAQVPLGFVSLVGAGHDRVFVLVAGSVDRVTSHEDEFLRAPVGPPSGFLLRMLMRNATSGWNVQTLALPPGIDDPFYIRGMRVDELDNLVVLVDSPYKQFVEIAPDGLTSVYIGEASVWRRTGDGRWTRVAVKTYPTKNYAGFVGFNGPRGVDSRGIEVDDLSIGPDGRIWVGGGGFGVIWSADSDGALSTVAQLSGHSEQQIGADGTVAQASFREAFQVTADANAVLFYDAATCQIRKLAGEQLSTLSGPVLSAVPTLGQRRLLGVAQGSLLFSNPPPFQTFLSAGGTGKWLGSIDLTTGNVRTLDSHGLVTQREADQVCRADLGFSGRYVPGPCNYTYVDPAPTTASTWIGLNGTTPIYATTIANSGEVALYAWQSPTSSILVSRASTWPGVGAGNAPSGPGDLHVLNGKAYLFGVVRTPTGSQETRIYEINLDTGQAVAVAGKTIASAVFDNAHIDLDVAAPVGVGPLYVQKRSDGAYWLATPKEVWLLDSKGALRRVAGSSTTGSVAADGSGAAVSFSFINRIRVLPDDRLLVVDRDAHALRLVDQSGFVSTVVGRLNQPGLVLGALPGGLASPLDAVIDGRDILISTRDSPNLVLARAVL